MKVKLLLTSLLLGGVVGVYGSGWAELPCESSIPEVRLEANDTSIRVSNKQKVLVTQMLCSPEFNLIEQLNTLLKGRGGHCVVNSHEEGLEFEYAPERIPLAASNTMGQKIGYIFVGAVASGCINGLPPEVKAAMANAGSRLSGQAEYSSAKGLLIQAKLAEDTSAKR